MSTSWVSRPERRTGRPRARAVLAGAVAGLIAGGSPPAAAPGCAADAMLVFDGSASMAEVAYDITEAPRIEEARAALRRALPGIAAVRDVGLLTYGPGGADSCTGIALRVPPGPRTAGAVIAAVEALEPGGLTPLAASVERAAEALDYRARPGVVVLVTDGDETCGGRPCALGARLAATGADLQVHVIGFRIVDDIFRWNSPEAEGYAGPTVAKCLADATGGLYVSTRTVDELVRALERTLGCPVIGAVEARRRG